MKFFDRVFHRKPKQDIPTFPSRVEIVEKMYGKNPGYYGYEILDVIYSKDRLKRYVILKNKKEIFTYILEEICIFDEKEWRLMQKYSNKYIFPAWWEEFGQKRKSLFNNLDELLKELKEELEYKKYF